MKGAAYLLRRGTGVLGACLVAWALGACADRPEPMELPALPDLAEAEEAVRDQFHRHFEVVKRLLGAEPRNEEALGRALGELGMVFHTYEDPVAARQCYRHARALDPREFRWGYLLGMVERNLGALEASNEAFLRALDLRPGDLPTVVWLGENAFDQNALDEASGRFQEALELAPDCAKAQLGAARVALEQGEPAKALGFLEAAFELQPQASPVLYNLGLAHRNLGNLEKAGEFFDRVPRSHLQRRGVAFEDPILEEVASLERGAMAHEHRGLRAAAQGRYGVAAAELRQVVALDPDHLEARHNLALAFLRLRREAEALVEIEEVLRRAPDFAPTHVLFAGWLREAGDLEKAEDHLRQAVSADPALATAHLALASLLEASGREDEAQASYDRVRVLDPVLLQDAGDSLEVQAP